jgi:hypothetical protein
MEALIDNDVLYKLARYDLLLEFERLLQIKGYEQPHGRVGTAPFALKVITQPVPKDRWPDPRQADALRAFCNSRSRGVTGTQADSLVALNVEAFDPGEITLVAYALEHAESLIFTGDKRAIRALASDTRLASVAPALQERFVHLEMVMEVLSNRLGWRRVATAVTASGVDAGLQFIYREPTENHMATALASSIAHLRAETDTLLISKF